MKTIRAKIEDLPRLTAEECKGWRTEWFGTLLWYVDRDNQKRCVAKKTYCHDREPIWQPTENLNQAWGLLEEWLKEDPSERDFCIYVDDIVDVTLYDHMEHCILHRNKCVAICLAVLAARGINVELED